MVYIDILILAIIAAFLGYRLWTILGTHDPDRPVRRKNSLIVDEDELLVRPRQRKSGPIEAEPHPEIPAFDEAAFLEGAELAFCMIVASFSQGDKKALKPLLAADVYKNFVKAIDARTKAGHTLEVELARIVKAEIINDVESSGLKEVTVKFVSEQSSFTRDKKGKVISGDPDQYHEITDNWTFSRQLSSTSPNWTLVSTQSGNEDEAKT